MCQIWHKKCQNLTHLFVIDGLTQKVSKNETFCSISRSREYVQKQETECIKNNKT
jgi:hypothetical protein